MPRPSRCCSPSSAGSRAHPPRTRQPSAWTASTWDPLPLSPPAVPEHVRAPAPERPFDTIMAALFHPEPPTLARYASFAARYTAQLARTQRKTIPGRTDGSDAWRTDVYSMSTPRGWTTAHPFSPKNRAPAYKTVRAVSQRPTATVVFTVSEHLPAPTPPASAPARPVGPLRVRAAHGSVCTVLAARALPGCRSRSSADRHKHRSNRRTSCSLTLLLIRNDADVARVVGARTVHNTPLRTSSGARTSTPWPKVCFPHNDGCQLANASTDSNDFDFYATLAVLSGARTPPFERCRGAP
jgi:hypothetical protein